MTHEGELTSPSPEAESRELDDEGRGRYLIDHIQVEKNRTTMILSAAKNGCNQIVFDFGERADLKGLLLGAFEGGKPFDFHIAEILGNGQCKINGISRAFSLAASLDSQEPGPGACAETKFFGPLFLTEYDAVGSAHHFWVNDPSKLPPHPNGPGDPVAVRVLSEDAALVSLMTTAFNSGKPVLVATAFGWYWLASGKFAWRIHKAKMTWQG